MSKNNEKCYSCSLESSVMTPIDIASRGTPDIVPRLDATVEEDVVGPIEDDPEIAALLWGAT